MLKNKALYVPPSSISFLYGEMPPNEGENTSQMAHTTTAALVLNCHSNLQHQTSHPIHQLCPSIYDAWFIISLFYRILHTDANFHRWNKYQGFTLPLTQFTSKLFITYGWTQCITKHNVMINILLNYFLKNGFNWIYLHYRVLHVDTLQKYP